MATCKTSELTGAALDWAVAKCEGWSYIALGRLHEIPKFSEWWAQGGPIIEREGISVSVGHAAKWTAIKRESAHPGAKIVWCAGGNNPLIAAMRAYVASKLGDEVEIPEELV